MSYTNTVPSPVITTHNRATTRLHEWLRRNHLDFEDVWGRNIGKESLKRSPDLIAARIACVWHLRQPDPKTREVLSFQDIAALTSRVGHTQVREWYLRALGDDGKRSIRPKTLEVQPARFDSAKNQTS